MGWSPTRSFRLRQPVEPLPGIIPEREQSRRGQRRLEGRERGRGLPTQEASSLGDLAQCSGPPDGLSRSARRRHRPSGPLGLPPASRPTSPGPPSAGRAGGRRQAATPGSSVARDGYSRFLTARAVEPQPNGAASVSERTARRPRHSRSLTVAAHLGHLDNPRDRKEIERE